MWGANGAWVKPDKCLLAREKRLEQGLNGACRHAIKAS
jgi:hypothetical protein